MTCGVTGVLISPISWDNHWVWIVPLLAILVDAAVRARGAWRWAFWGLTGAVLALFADWPGHWTGPQALVPHGLVGFFAGRHPKSEIFHLHGVQLISWNLYILAGLVIFAALLAAAALAWRRGGPDGSGRNGASQNEGGGRSGLPGRRAAATAEPAGGPAS